MSQSKPEETPNLKVLKSDTNRRDFVLDHRKNRKKLYEMISGNSNSSSPRFMTTLSIEPTFMSTGPLEEEFEHPEILLKDMDKSKEHVYSGRTLVLTLIDDPMLGMSSVNFVAEDKNKDVTRLSVYGLPHDRSTCDKYGFGTVIAIVNPYLRVAVSDGKFVIRVDQPQTIIQVGRKKRMCRYCGEQNAEKKCKECQRSYCNRDCQMEDWKMLKHKMVCKTPVSWSVNAA